MKNIDEISRLTADDLERISLDESITVPEELSRKVQQAVRSRTLRWAVPTGVAAAIAVLLAVGLTRNQEPKAYAEVEKVFSKISDTVTYGADKISESEATIEKYSYWK